MERKLCKKNGAWGENIRVWSETYSCLPIIHFCIEISILGLNQTLSHPLSIPFLGGSQWHIRYNAALKFIPILNYLHSITIEYRMKTMNIQSILIERILLKFGRQNVVGFDN